MAETTIEWTSYRRPDGSKVPGYTFNPWIGCAKVSAGCKNCYAETETFARVQRSHGRELWGVGGDRHVTSDANWAKPRSWNREAEQAGERRRVFCASMADIFEDRPDLRSPRQRLWRMIDDTPWLDWLILTKRPENIKKLYPPAWAWPDEDKRWVPENVWLGVSVEDQATADKRIPELLKIPAMVRFLSIEPLLGPVDLRLTVEFVGGSIGIKDIARDIHWIIVGGESGPNARPMHPDWVRSLRYQSQLAGIPFFFKQWGEYHPAWCDGRERLGKKRAGRTIDGRTWDESPSQSSVACVRHGYDDCPACTGGE